ncbi:FAD-dependent oxidoreductase [Adlercreutzia sp. R7]|uniref:FAD-dependent oxidoreductase n=1 Tax=Adlercreutzia wanghongyangiae TaxID=3111451 RepID=A0ABU6IH55_9ACTN|nr:FAD-dependent oxidoreductase [Adlercreutzia sp. R7]
MAKVSDRLFKERKRPMDRNLSRRSFVATSVLAGISAALGLQGCAPEERQQAAEGEAAGSSETADAVIVGGGLAGMMAAITLSDLKPEAKIILLEQQDSLGGSLKLSDGYFVGFSKRYNESPADCASADEIITMIDAAANDVERHGYAEEKGCLNSALQESYFSRTAEVIKALMAMGVPFPDSIDVDVPYAAGAYATDIFAAAPEGSGGAFADAVIKQLEKTSVDVRTDCQATALVAEGTTVTGIEIEQAGKTSAISSRAVLLATGGFAANPDKISEHLPAFSKCNFLPNPGATGMAIDFTRQFNTPLVSDGVYGGMIADDDTIVVTACNFLVNEKGERFCDETENWYLIMWPLVQHTENSYAWCICDSDYVEQNEEETRPKIDAGSLVPFDTIEELCAATGIDADALKATIETYNADATAGRELPYGLPAEYAHKVERAPFYAEKATTYCFGTIKGLKIDENCQVVAGDGAPITGLYAAGEVAAGNAYFGQYPAGGAGNSLASLAGHFAAIRLCDNL